MRAIHSSGSRKPILIVEDDALTRGALCDLLELEGYTVQAVCDGVEAIEYVRQHDSPGLIILDLMMPRMDGWRFREEQKKYPKLDQCPVVVISASVQDKDVDADVVLHKPVDVDLLLSSIAEYC
jgi:two-component system, chemotaxis family, chemotaxis protein CheY